MEEHIHVNQKNDKFLDIYEFKIKNNENQDKNESENKVKLNINNTLILKQNKSGFNIVSVKSQSNLRLNLIENSGAALHLDFNSKSRSLLGKSTILPTISFTGSNYFFSISRVGVLLKKHDLIINLQKNFNSIAFKNFEVYKYENNQGVKYSDDHIYLDLNNSYIKGDLEDKIIILDKISFSAGVGSKCLFDNKYNVYQSAYLNSKYFISLGIKTYKNTWFSFRISFNNFNFYSTKGKNITFLNSIMSGLLNYSISLEIKNKKFLDISLPITISKNHDTDLVELNNLNSETLYVHFTQTALESLFYIIIAKGIISIFSKINNYFSKKNEENHLLRKKEIILDKRKKNDDLLNKLLPLAIEINTKEINKNGFDIKFALYGDFRKLLSVYNDVFFLDTDNADIINNFRKKEKKELNQILDVTIPINTLIKDSNLDFCIESNMLGFFNPLFDDNKNPWLLIVFKFKGKRKVYFSDKKYVKIIN